MHDQFKSFLLNEQKYYLAQRAGDTLTALQNLEDDAPNMGNRALLRASQGIVNQIRRILHGRWDESDIKYLKKLQKVGVAISKAIDEKTDMVDIIASAAAEVQKMIDDLGVPINSLASEEEQPDEDEEPDFSKESEEPLRPGTEFQA